MRAVSSSSPVLATPNCWASDMAKTAKTHNLAYLHRDRGYRFQDRDPAMVELCNIIYASELPIHQICNAVSKATAGSYRVSESTIANWLNGKTRRPQNLTLSWVGYALGYRREWTKL